MMTAIKDIKPGLKNINVMFIVLEIGSSTVTKENREVRNYKVADHSACINVSIWDEPGKGISPGDIIKMTKGYASIWRNCLTLYSGKNGEVVKIGEFCMNFSEALNMSEPKRPEQQQQALPPTNASANALQASATNINTTNNENVVMQAVPKQPTLAVGTVSLNAGNNTGNSAQNQEPAAVTPSVTKMRGTRASSIKVERR